KLSYTHEYLGAVPLMRIYLLGQDRHRFRGRPAPLVVWIRPAGRDDRRDIAFAVRPGKSPLWLRSVCWSLTMRWPDGFCCSARFGMQQFYAALPLLHFLRKVTKVIDWRHAPRVLYLDDPNLRLPSYEVHANTPFDVMRGEAIELINHVARLLRAGEL